MWPFKPKEQRSIENPSVSLSDPNAWQILFGGGASAAGVSVTPEKALGVPAVWAAINFISGTIASLPLSVYRRTSDGRERADRDPLHALLHDAPNPEWTSFRWRKYSMVNTLLRGRSYTFIERNAAGRPMAFWPLDPTQVSIERREGRTVYTYAENGATYRADEILDIPFMLGVDGLAHVDPTDRLRNAIGLAIALEEYASRFFQNGGVPPLSLQGPISSPAAAQRAAHDITENLKSARDSKRNVLVMPAGHELKPIGVDPEKSQMNEARRYQLEEIARVYDLPPVFLQDLTHGTYSNTEQQDLHFVKHTLTQWLRAWEQEMNLKLFAGRGRFVEFNLDGLLRGDFQSRMAGYATAVQNAIRTPDEIRAMENQPPKGGAADKLHIQGATVPIGTQPTNDPGNEDDV
jgi:HK97 family phage portal protein